MHLPVISSHALALTFAFGALLSTVPTAHAQTLAGKLPAEFSVSATGAANYRIPLQVPPGVAGLEPKLALVYNSQSGNGLLGMGWSIEGLSAITRCPQTMSTDGVLGAVSYNQDDRFCLDGQRLIGESGGYGAAGSQYRTEIDSFSRISAFGAAGGVAVNGPVSFTVQTKAGLNMQYGSTADARIEPQSKTAPRVWALNQIKDAADNLMNLAYTEDAETGSYRLRSITYAGNRRIDWVYETRPDVFSGYAAGALQEQRVRLKEVQVYIGTALVHRYQLAYTLAAGTGRSMLSSVTQCDASGACLAPTTFEGAAVATRGVNAGNWTTGAYGAPWDAAGSQSRIRPMDLDGDGRQDLLIGPDGAGNWHVLRSTGSSFVNAGRWASAMFGSPWDEAAQQSRIRAMDVNGDGKHDIVVGPDGYGTWFGKPSTGVSLANPGAWITGVYASPWSDPAQQGRIRQMDVNGDGLQDILIGPDSAGRWYVLKSIGGAFVNAGLWATTPFAQSPWDAPAQQSRIRPMDVTGDGLLDLVIGPTSAGNWHVLRSTGSTFVEAGPNGGQWATGQFPSPWSNDDNQNRIRPMDVNGDGLQDLVIGPNAEGAWHVMLSTGTSFVNKGAWITGAFANPWNTSANQARIRPMDVNADGLQDLLIGPDSTGQWQVLQSTGTSFVTATWATGAFGSPWDQEAQQKRIRAMDVTGDGLQDLVIGPDSAGNWQVLRAETSFDRIVTIREGAGPVIQIDYASYATTQPLPSSAVDAYPTASMSAPIALVTAVGQSNGTGSLNTTTYAYGGLRLEHASGAGKGRGLLGFESMASRDTAAGISIRTQFRQDWPYTGQIATTETRLGEVVCASASSCTPSAGTLLKKTTYTYGCQLPLTLQTCDSAAPGQVHFVHPATVTEESWDLNGRQMPTLITRHSYGQNTGDSQYWGDPTSVVVDTVQDGVTRSTQRTDSSYLPADTASGRWVLGRLQKVSVSTTRIND